MVKFCAWPCLTWLVHSGRRCLARCLLPSPRLASQRDFQSRPNSKRQRGKSKGSSVALIQEILRRSIEAQARIDAEIAGKIQLLVCTVETAVGQQQGIEKIGVQQKRGVVARTHKSSPQQCRPSGAVV